VKYVLQEARNLKIQNNNTKHIFMKKIPVIIITMLALVIFISRCSKTASPTGNAVWMQNMAFTPSTLTVPVNTTVTWTNKDPMAHTVTSNSGLFSSGNVNPNATYSFQFTTAGTYPYHCTIHPYMTGTIIVQ
jgi:plastocyanin